MIQEIRSRVDDRLLHLIFRPEESENLDLQRTELIEPNNFLQSAFLQIPPNFNFRAHEHLTRSRSFNNLVAQESWVVIEGLVEVTYFDLDQTKIGSFELKKGQVSITLHGGHSYRTLNAAAKVYEFKTGPYEGQEIDKRFL